LFFSLLVITVSFMADFAMEAQERAMSRPLPWTKSLFDGPRAAAGAAVRLAMVCRR